jgi:hypothetical protein
VDDEISVGRALGAGFDLIRRHPAAVAVWALAYLILGVLPQAGLMALIGPAWLRMFQEAGRGAPSPETLQSQAQVMQLEPLGWVLGLVCATLLLGGAYRAVLFPEERRFFYLRFGVRELWLAFVMVVLTVGFAVVFFLGMLPVFVVAGIGAATREPVVSVLAVPLVFVVLGVVAWLFLRMSLALPMTFAERRFRLFESWSATRGNGWRLFGLAAVIWLLLIVAELILGLGGFMLLGGPARLSQFAALARDPQALMSRMAPIWLGFSVVAVVLTTVFYALVGAAWADIYRQLKPQLTDVF